MSILIGSNTKIKNSIIGRDKKREKELEQEITRLNNIINELTNRINKAIEYIEKRTKETDFDNDKLIDILDILKGTDKES